ncbi:unnamed protein product [Linum trigynum]|uniref:Uncharacterized protein n=1 Tax=Linum trigynum TaxID=586398 RepID=A0AAV2GMG3_9ROSI
MAYRRRGQPSPPSYYYSYENQRDERKGREGEERATLDSTSTATGLAAKAIRASSAAQTLRESSLSSAYTLPPSPSSAPSSSSSSSFSANAPATAAGADFKDPALSPHAYTSMSSFNQSNRNPNPNPNPNPDPDPDPNHNPKPGGFWGSLARKAKSFLDDDDANENENGKQQNQQPRPQYQQDRDFVPRQDRQPHSPPPDPQQMSEPASSLPKSDTRHPPLNGGYKKKEGPVLRKGLNAISSSINYIGNAVEEGLMKVENRTADIIQETRKHIGKKPGGTATKNPTNSQTTAWQQPPVQSPVQAQMQADLELQLKASRDVAMAMAAKAKLLLRELKTVKADLAFAKERCAQLEEENKVLRESHERGDNLEDDDLIRLQLETLLAEKARLAHENSVCARENRFLREVVEYHQLTMQDVVYLDEGTEEVTEVYPIKVVSNTPSNPSAEMSNCTSLVGDREMLVHPVPPPGLG